MSVKDDLLLLFEDLHTGEIKHKFIKDNHGKEVADAFFAPADFLFSGKIKEVHFEENRKPSGAVYSDTVYCLRSLFCTDKSSARRSGPDLCGAEYE